MEKDLKFNSAICTSRSQSEKLLALGLKKETADCQYAALIMDWKGNPISNPEWRFYDHNKSFIVQNFEQMECIPAWSLHRLVEMVPLTIWHTEYEDSPRLKHAFWFSKYAPSYDSTEDIDFREHPNLYDNIIDCIEWLIKEGYFNKDYLEEKQ